MANFQKTIVKFCVWSGAKVFESCRSRKMLQNAYLDVKIGVDTEENEPSKVDLILVNFSPAQGFNFHMCIPTDRAIQLMSFENIALSTVVHVYPL